MGKYLLKRLINYMIMFFVAVTLAYFLAASRLNPLLLYDITNPNLDWDSINASLTDKNLNPDEPILSRYLDWLGGVIHGDWGQKPKSGSVNDEIINRVPVSFRLVIGGFLIGSIGGILLGAWTATKQYKPSDRLVTLWSLIIISTPTFVIAVVLQIVTIRLAGRSASSGSSSARAACARGRSSRACSTVANTCCSPRSPWPSRCSRSTAATSAT